MIQPGFYRHHGGGTYTVTGLAEDSTNAREKPDGTQPLVVIYISHTYGHVCVRDLAEFTELVAWPATEFTKAGELHPRFMRWPEPERSKNKRPSQAEQLRKAADAAWERGDKPASDELHRQARELEGK